MEASVLRPRRSGGHIPVKDVIFCFSVRKDPMGRSGEISAGVSRAPASSL